MIPSCVWGSVFSCIWLDPSTLFSDPAYFKTKARIEQISKSEVMTPEERINTFREIIKDAKAEAEKLRAELADLQKQLAAGVSAASEPEPAMSESEPEPEAAPAAPAKKKAGKKKGKKK